MKIKEFEAYTLKDCLQLVRQELGPEAVILETHKKKKGGFLGIGARDAVRIVAATGVSVKEGAGKARAATLERPEPEVAERKNDRAVKSGAVRQAYGFEEPPMEERIDRTAVVRVPGSPSSGDEKFTRMERELRDIKSSIESMKTVVTDSGNHRAVVTAEPRRPEARINEDILRMLEDSGISRDLREELVANLPDLSAWNSQARTSIAESALKEMMAERVYCSGPIQQETGKTRNICLIGPTGVGKTTTIAKLAAQFGLIEQRSVGLLTMDTYRIAAVDQLKTYSQIMDLPIEVAYSVDEVNLKLRAFRKCDIVLIDTAGRSQKNVTQVSELKSLIDGIDCETHLVLSSSTKEKDLLEQIDRFSQARVDRLLFTKLDETTSYGTLVSVAAKTRIPISYMTVGQKVPEDIEVADAARLASLALHGPKK